MLHFHFMCKYIWFLVCFKMIPGSCLWEKWVAEDRAWMETYCTVLVYILKSVPYTCNLSSKINKINKKMKTEENNRDTQTVSQISVIGISGSEVKAWIVSKAPPCIQERTTALEDHLQTWGSPGSCTKLISRAKLSWVWTDKVGSVPRCLSTLAHPQCLVVWKPISPGIPASALSLV